LEDEKRDVLSRWEVLSSELSGKADVEIEGMRNEKCGMRNGLARKADREVLSVE
jgi:hypothetical protein